MRILYLDCGMGAAGDMLTAALYELLEDKEGFLRELRAAGIEDVTFTPEQAVKCGITGTHMKVLAGGVEEEEALHAHPHHDHTHPHDHDHDHEHHHDHDHPHDHDHHHDHDHPHDHEHHHHSSVADIHRILDGLQVSESVKQHAKAVYGLIAEAESHAHGVPVTDIHFHEVGTLDAIADVTAVCLLLEKLHPDRILATPVHVGSGHVHCAHGILPVPAPATAYILKDVPVYGGRVDGELCTPTGAALLKHFTDQFGEMPVMKVERIGYGMGKKDFEYANCIRAMIGDTQEQGDTVTELTCNLDDMTGEKIAFAMDTLLQAGALEAFCVPVTMKKSRPGVMLCVLCAREETDRFVQLMLRHTTTLGIRENICRRYTLSRHVETQSTPFGEIRVKCSEGYGIRRKKYEYEDLARIAREKDLSIEEIEQEL